MNRSQELVLQLAQAGKNIFITGSAGTGKSFTIERLVTCHIRSVFCTASTGVAACLLNVKCPVSTLHAWAGIGLGTSQVLACVRKIRSNKKTFARIRSTKTIIIDEVSMLDSTYFDKLNTVLKVLFSTEKAFGGIQVVLCGDFLQLPPPNGRFIFESVAWKELKLANVNLLTNYRQNDLEFTKILTSIRVGDINPGVISFLKEKRGQIISSDNGIIATKLFCTNLDVDALNKKELDKLSGEEVVFDSNDVGKPCSNLPKTLHLKNGAQVMLLKNLDIENELVNGSRGIVTSIDPLLVHFINGIEVEISPIVQCNTDTTQKDKWKREQIPLRLAWASTIHKSQGASIDLLQVDFRGAFADGQVYTALSRCRTSQNLCILNFHPKQIRVSQKALCFYQNIQ